LAALGVELVEVPEGHRRALYYYAYRQRICALMWERPEDAVTRPYDMVHRLFSGWRPFADTYLVKEANSLNPTLDRFWSLAARLFSRTAQAPKTRISASRVESQRVV
jgi:hypothetical protein